MFSLLFQMSSEDDAAMMNNNFAQVPSYFPSVQLSGGFMVTSNEDGDNMATDSMDCDMTATAQSTTFTPTTSYSLSTSSSPDGQCVGYSRCYCKLAAVKADMMCSRAYYISDYY